MSDTHAKKVCLLILVMFLWGSLATFTKISYSVFQIDTSFLPDILLLAGIRFALCGTVTVISFTATKNCKNQIRIYDIRSVFIVGLLSIVLHYRFNYIGLSLIDSSEAVLIKQLGTAIFIPLTFLFFKEDKFSIKKLLAAICGLSGVIALNWNSDGLQVNKGALFTLMASFALVMSFVFGKRVMKTVHPIAMTGYSQLFGGIVLLMIGIVGGGTFKINSPASFAVFFYICISTVLSYSLWNWILKSNHLSELCIIKFLEPVFAAAGGALLLGEQVFHPRFMIALFLTCIAIFFSQK